MNSRHTYKPNLVSKQQENKKKNESIVNLLNQIKQNKKIFSIKIETYSDRYDPNRLTGYEIFTFSDAEIQSGGWLWVGLLPFCK
jgi:ribosomal 30S subunit maturation factor RimM